MDYVAVSVECEITRLDNHLTTVDGVVCIHYQGHVYCCAVLFVERKQLIVDYVFAVDLVPFFLR